MRLRKPLTAFGKRLSAVAVTVVVIVLFVAGIGAGLALAFTDVGPNDHYAEAIEELSNLGIITGFQDGSFRPNDLVTRQQFAKMIVLTLGLQVTGNERNPFGDVESQTGSDPFYPSKYVAVCALNGITQGKTAYTFAPYDNITRAQVMSMVVRAASKFGVPLVEPTPAYYSDSKYIMRNFDDPNHGRNAHIAELSGLLWGIFQDPGGGWNAYKNATRGEVAQILWRLKQKMTPPSTETTQPPNTQPLAHDDFSNPNSGWAVGEDSQSSVGYSSDAGGTYKMHLKQPNLETVTWWGDVFDSVYYEAWAYPQQNAQGTGWEYGLVFRIQGDSASPINNLYELSIMGDGTARLWKRVDGQWTQMSQVVNLPPPQDPNNPWRYLAVQMVADTFTAWVDNVVIGEFTDSTFASGQVGFYVATYDAPDFTTWFDEFTVWPIVY